MPVVACLTGRAGHDVILDAPRELADISDQPRLSGSVRYFRAVTAAAIGGQAIQYVASCCVSPTACRDADQRQVVHKPRSGRNAGPGSDVTPRVGRFGRSSRDATPDVVDPAVRDAGGVSRRRPESGLLRAVTDRRYLSDESMKTIVARREVASPTALTA